MVCYSIFVDRPFSLGFLVMLDDDGTFDVEEIEPKQAFDMNDDEIVYAHMITRRPSGGAGGPTHRADDAPARATDN